MEHLGVLDAGPLVEHVANDQSIGLILETEQLRDGLVASDVRSWEVDGLLDVPLLVLVGVAQVKQQELSIGRDAEHISSVGDGRCLGEAGTHGGTSPH